MVQHQRSSPKLTKVNRGWNNLRPARNGEPSRNPSGRPKKDLEITAIARGHAKLAIDTLVTCMTDDAAPSTARISAAAEIFNRGYGSTPRLVDVGHRISFGEEFECFIWTLDPRAEREL